MSFLRTHGKQQAHEQAHNYIREKSKHKNKRKGIHIHKPLLAHAAKTTFEAPLWPAHDEAHGGHAAHVGAQRQHQAAVEDISHLRTALARQG